MSHDYIMDLFGKFRKGKKTRFSELEETAKDLLKKFVQGEISNKEFATEFKGVGRRFNELTDNGNEIVIDEETPLWLNSLLGLHFIDWLRYQQVEQYFEEHPEELIGERKETFEELQRCGYTERFKSVCQTAIEELNK